MTIIRTAVEDFAETYISNPPPFTPPVERRPRLSWARRRWERQFKGYLSVFVARLVEAGIVQYTDSERGEL